MLIILKYTTPGYLPTKVIKKVTTEATNIPINRTFDYEITPLY